MKQLDSIQLVFAQVVGKVVDFFCQSLFWETRISVLFRGSARGLGIAMKSLSRRHRSSANVQSVFM